MGIAAAFRFVATALIGERTTLPDTLLASYPELADLADRLATWTEHRQPIELRDEDSGVWRHGVQVMVPGAGRVAGWHSWHAHGGHSN